MIPIFYFYLFCRLSNILQSTSKKHIICDILRQQFVLCLNTFTDYYVQSFIISCTQQTMMKLFGRRNRINDPDSAWKLQNREFKNHPLYRLVDFKDSGKLIDAFRKGGKAKLVQVLKEDVEPLLYERGQGKIITKMDYLRWRYNYHLKMVVSTFFQFYLELWNGSIIITELVFLILRQFKIKSSGFYSIDPESAKYLSDNNIN